MLNLEQKLKYRGRYKVWQKEYDRKKYLKNKDIMNKKRVVQKYSLTLDKYELMLKEQNGVCFICKRINTNGRRLFIDHCHRTGVVRGLLCGYCNSILGYCQENPDILKGCVSYIENNCRGINYV